MLPPEELRNQSFSKVIRGYNPEEVDQHIDFIIEKYSEIYVQNELLKRKLNSMTAQYNKLKANEEAIKATLLNAQTASSKLINETCERSELMLKNTKEDCNKILTEYRHKVEYQQYILSKLDEQINEFKTFLFNKYKNHIQLIESINTKALTNDEWMMSEEVFIDRIKRDVEEKDREFDENANVAADPEINSEENKQKVEAEVQLMIENEKAAIEAKRAEEEEKRRAEEESLRLLRESRPEVSESDEELISEDQKEETAEEISTAVVVSEFDYDNNGEYEIVSDEEIGDAELEEISKNAGAEDEEESVVDADVSVSDEEAEIGEMIDELNRIFGAESAEGSEESLISDEEHDEMDEEILRLLNDIAGSSSDSESK